MKHMQTCTSILRSVKWNISRISRVPFETRKSLCEASHNAMKTNKLSYQDVGQMDMYVKMYDELVRPNGHNPTIGILLCADTDEDVAHYSVLNNNDQLFAAKYLTYMPTQEELRREIEQQKEFYRLQNGG